ncbi:MAG: right-handed parallel beta-helix repeat-containing protein [Solirubrobacterales bacterium]
MTTAFGLVAILAAAGPAVGAEKRKGIHVRPGQDAISRALARADDGDVLRIHKGRYPEAFTVEESVKLVAAGNRRPVIDARCEERFAVAVRADDVRLKRLKVIGADADSGFPTEVDFNGVTGGRAKDLVLRDTCDAEYGINVFDTGAMEIVDSRAHGFDDAGFYVGQITSTPTGPIRVRRSEAYGNLRGVIVENSTGGDIRVARNDLHDNNINFSNALGTGVLILNSDSVLVKSNDVSDNAGFGLHVSADAGANVINDNVFVGNPLDIFDQGTGTCGTGNISTTGDSIPPC